VVVSSENICYFSIDEQAVSTADPNRIDPMFVTGSMFAPTT
jgi:hypothetical protein